MQLGLVLKLRSPWLRPLGFSYKAPRRSPEARKACCIHSIENLNKNLNIIFNKTYTRMQFIELARTFDDEAKKSGYQHAPDDMLKLKTNRNV